MEVSTKEISIKEKSTDKAKEDGRMGLSMRDLFLWERWMEKGRSRKLTAKSTRETGIWISEKDRAL